MVAEQALVPATTRLVGALASVMTRCLWRDSVPGRVPHWPARMPAPSCQALQHHPSAGFATTSRAAAWVFSLLKNQDRNRSIPAQKPIRGWYPKATRALEMSA